MTKNSSAAHMGTHNTSKDIAPGVIAGGLAGLLVGFLHRTGILIIPGFSSIFNAIPLNETISGALIGIIIGALIKLVFILGSTEKMNDEYIPEESTPKQSIFDGSESITLQIKEEQINLAKKWIQTGEAKIYRETFAEEKSFTVPVNREELVIEKRTFVSAASEHKDVPTEIIRIPLSVEQVELIKHRVALEDVSIYKQQIQDIKHIEGTLKREEPKVKISGSPKMKDE